MNWSDLSIKEKIALAWGQRIAIPKPSKFEALRSHLSISQWKFRFSCARAAFESEQYWNEEMTTAEAADIIDPYLCH